MLDPVSQTERVTDILIVDGIIEAIADDLFTTLESSPDTQVYDRPHLVVGPGLVDLYSHSGEPGFEARETLESLLKTAAAGGFTRITLLPDTQPALDNPGGIDRIRSQLTSLSHLPTRLYYWGALTAGVQGTQMTELAELAQAGVVGFADGQPLPAGALLRRILEYAQPLAKPVALWCCNPDLAGNGVVREGLTALSLGLPGSPAIAETTALSALLEYVEAIGTPVHIMRVSTARSVELIQTAKARGLPITASTPWIYLLLNTTALQSYDPSLRLAPPLGNPDDQQALIQGVEEGIIDAIAIDHTPYTYEEKTVAFAEAPPGTIGLELALPLLWQFFVVARGASPLWLWQLLSTNPAHCLQQTPPSLQVGQVAELALFDPQISWSVTSQTLHSLAANTPWWHKTLTGQVVKTWGPGHSSLQVP